VCTRPHASARAHEQTEIAPDAPRAAAAAPRGAPAGVSEAAPLGEGAP
jgi:hypothetical protein